MAVAGRDQEIKKRFGVESAIDCLLFGEKLLTFAKTADCRSEFAAEFPPFQAEVWNVFNRYEIAGYLTTLKAVERKKLQRLLYIGDSSSSRRSV